MEISNFCKENQVFIHVLKAHCTHITQPLDVVLFDPIKKAAYRIALAWVARNPTKPLSKYTKMKEVAYPAFEAVLGKKSNIVSAFRASGIFPFDSRNVHWEKTKAADIYEDEDLPGDIPEYVIFPPPAAPVVDNDILNMDGVMEVNVDVATGSIPNEGNIVPAANDTNLDVYDNVDYLSSLGKSQTAAVKRDAEIGVAQVDHGDKF